MKKVYVFLVFLLVAHAGFSQVTWQAPVAVAAGTYGNLHPRIALNRAGNPMILWGKGSDAYFSRWTGSAFSTPLMLNTGTTTPIFTLSWAGPDLASFGDTVYAVMKKTPETEDTNYNFIVHSYDGGASFSVPIRADFIGPDKSRFPLVTTDGTGNPIVSFMRMDPMLMNPRYVVTKSADYGMTFSPDVQASVSTAEVCDCCPATLISSGSKLILLYRNNATNIRDTWEGISNDGGATFPGHVNVDNNSWMVMSCPSSGPDGFVVGDSMYSVFRSSTGGTAKVYLSRASISGMTSSTAMIMGPVTGLLAQDYPRIANVGSAATAVWKQNVSPGGVSIVYSFTNNISSGFSSYSTVTSATGSGMVNADVAMTNGAIHIVWEDDNAGTVKYIKGTYTPASVASLSTKELITLYPNPAKGAFTVNAKTTVNYCYLTDNLGRQTALQYTPSNGSLTVSLAGIAKGMYYFVMGDEAGKVYYSKLIVE